MTSSIAPVRNSPGIVSALRKLRKPSDAAPYGRHPAIPVLAKDISVLQDPIAFRTTLLALIAKAEHRILITALYLQDDEGGREVLSALYAAKRRCPDMDIRLFVDWHRAQRGLIGKAKSEGNAALYKAAARDNQEKVDVFGIPVQRRELLGVMHLKGFVIDDTVLFSGASLNDVYLQKSGRYRIDRYHLIHNKMLADKMAHLITDLLGQHPAVISLNQPEIPKTAAIKKSIVSLRRALSHASYDGSEQSGELSPDQVSITPLLGLGVRKNVLNSSILRMIQQAQRYVVLFTPYFNLPGPVRRAIDSALKKGCRVTVVLGDKTANDFYIPPTEPFKVIGALPYLYEINLRRFCEKRQGAIDAGLLNVHLWKHDDNSFHLKGLLIDEQYALLTGHNINPRAWRLDLENGLIIHDPHHLLVDMHHEEMQRLLVQTVRLAHFSQIDEIKSYPLPVQRLIRRLSHVRIDKLINQVL